MRPDDITIQEIAKKHAADVWGKTDLVEAMENAITEALDHLDEADLASQLQRAENDRESWYHKWTETRDQLNAANLVIKLRDAEIRDLRFAAEGWKAKATAGKPIDL